jgi:hypothetical protein
LGLERRDPFLQRRDDFVALAQCRLEIFGGDRLG